MCKTNTQPILDKKFVNTTAKAAWAWDLQCRRAKTRVDTAFQPVSMKQVANLINDEFSSIPCSLRFSAFLKPHEQEKKFCCNKKPSIFVAIKNSKNLIMNKAELIATIADEAGITKTQANATLDSFVKAVTKTLKGNGKVTLVGFGTFSVSKRAARNGRNPQSGAVIKIKAKKVAKFKAGKELSAKL
jgi:DNA-binding protein HU-beta